MSQHQTIPDTMQKTQCIALNQSGDSAMRQGQGHGFGEDYQRCFDELNRAIAQLGGQADPAQLSVTAELIIQTMSGPWRSFHTSEHIFEVGESGDAIEVLSALFHDLVYVQVDQGVSVNISRYIAPFVKEIGGQLVILERWLLPNDPLFEMVSQIFDLAAGQTLKPMAGQNEFLSALIAAKCLEHALPLAKIAEVAACIEATIPFRPVSETGTTAGDRLHERLVQTNETFNLGWSADAVDTIVRRATRLSNRDIENFAYESSAKFLDNTWNLMPETNHDLTSANAYTVTGFRVSLQKMEGFMNFLKPELVFQRYRDEPNPEIYQVLISRTQKNLEVARLYLGSKLLSIAVIEALSQRLGQDIPLATMMGELPGRGLSSAQLENFLPSIPVQIPPETALEQEVLELLKKGRSKSSSYDVKNSPTATYIIKSIGFSEARRSILQAKEFFKRNISAEEFLASCDQTVVNTIVRAVLQVFENRKAALAGVGVEAKVEVALIEPTGSENNTRLCYFNDDQPPDHEQFATRRSVLYCDRRLQTDIRWDATQGKQIRLEHRLVYGLSVKLFAINRADHPQQSKQVKAVRSHAGTQIKRELRLLIIQRQYPMDGREFYSSLIRLHILHHAVQEPIFGLGIIEELARHGYKLSAGTLYPMLHEMERKGYLHSVEERSGRQLRRLYRATDLGKTMLEDAKEKVRELFGELFEAE